MRVTTALACFALASFVTGVSSGAIFYANNFETDTTASWTVNNGPSDQASNFFFDYSTVGIPKSPSSALADGTRGMKLQANLTNGIFGGMSVSPTGQDFGDTHKVTFDWWANFNGPFPGGGSGSTNLSTFGVGTGGTTAQWPGGIQDSIWFGATGDGGSSSDWRAYSPIAGTSYTAASGVYAAGTGASPDARNSSHPYYASFGGNAAPAAQLLLFPQQTGSTGAGAAGMEWHQVVIERGATNVTWTVDNVLMATVPVGDDTADTVNNIFFGYSDTNTSSSTDVNDAALLFSLIDNVRVIPEPATIAILLVGFLGITAIRRR